MKVYLVGGAIRDRLLGLPVYDRDWVVTGSTPEEMEALGFKAVGRDFPVFLHPETHEEYALARSERKIGPGYHGFRFHASPEVGIEDDLRRRDLTINAMAEDEDGHLIDPFGGRRDLERRLLRHVSPAFAEDPVRILRLARFAARFATMGFTIAPETREIMHRMVESGEVDALVPERVWQEFVRALDEARPSVFITTLRDCGACARLFPDIDRLFGVPQPAVHHPEVDTGQHTLLALDYAAGRGEIAEVRFAVLCHDLGKGLTPRENWPGHRGHERRGLAAIDALADRYRIPRRFRDLARIVCRYHTHCHRAQTLRPATMLHLLEAIDALRRPARLEPFLAACLADARGRKGFETRAYPQADIVRQALAAVRTVDVQALCREGLKGAALAERLRQERIRAIAQSRTLPSKVRSG